MDPVRWRLVKDVFEKAIACSGGDREAFLADACAGDAALRAEVEQLVRAHGDAGEFLDAPAHSMLGAAMLALHEPASAPAFDLYQAGDDFRGTDRFTVIRRLGGGGMGVVYEVHDRVRDEIVALKTLRRATAADIYRLKREFRGLADLAHPNVVCLHELFVEPAACFFTMERVAGVGLTDYVRQPADDVPGATALDANRARQTFAQLVAALLDLHGRGKLHRDIKPSNVMVTPEGRVVVLDFGLISDAIDSGAIDAGTPAYLAPERHDGAPASEATDWYAVGVTMYEALIGRVPFAGTLDALRELKTSVDVTPPADIDASVPSDLNEVCVGLLWRDPARRLTGRDALARLAADSSSRSGPGADALPATPFVGRRDQLDLLERAFASAAAGRTAAVYVHGSSGIGKTALVQQFLDRTAGRALILRGRCYEHESVPYKALDAMIDSLSQHLAARPWAEVTALLPADVRTLSRLFPVLLQVDAIARTAAEAIDGVDPLALRHRALAALRALLARLASRQPLILYVDDLHWADADSVLLLEELLRPPDAPGLLMIACVRAEETAAKPFLRTLIEPDAALTRTVIPLTPVADEDAIALIDALTIAAPVSDDDRQQIAHDAGGNPFLLEQLASHAATRPAAAGATATFSQMLASRVAALPAGAQRLLEIVAVCGRPIAPALVHEAAGLAGDERPLVARLRAAHLLRSSGSAERVEMYHDRIRESLTASLTADDQRRIHERMVHVLERRHPDEAEALYVHYRGAGDRQRAATLASRAARKADAALAFDRAAMFYRSALELAPDSPEHLEWQEALAVALVNAGRPTEAADTFLDVSGRTADSTHRIELRRRAAEQLLVGGHIDRGLDVVRSLVDDISTRVGAGHRMALARLLLCRARLWWRGTSFVPRDAAEIDPATLFRVDTYWSITTGLMLLAPVRAMEFHTRYLLLALEAGEPYRVARGLGSEAALSALGGSRNAQRTAALIERANALAAQVGYPEAIAGATLAEGSAAFLVGQWKKASSLCDRALAILRERCVGATWELNCAQNFLVGALMYQGRLRDVSQRFPGLLADAREHGNLYIEAELRTRMTYVFLAADDPDEAERQAHEIMRHWSQRFDRQRYNYVVGLLQIELYRGRAQHAWRLIEQHWPAIRRTLLLRIQSIRVEASYLRARCALLMASTGTDRRRFLSIARREARRLERQHVAWSDPFALLVSAVIASLESDRSIAERRFAHAADGFDRADMPLYAAVSRRGRGVLLGGAEGRALIGQADAWMASEGIKDPARMTQLLAPGLPEF